MRKVFRSGRVVAAVLVSAGAGALFSALAGAAQNPLSAKGDLTFQAVTGPSCASGVGLCTAGSLTGKLKGTFASTATSLIQSVETPTTGVLFLTADVTVTTADGTLHLKDATALGTAPNADAFAGVWTIVGSTGKYLGATGQLTVTGTFTQTAGGTGSYSGAITLA